MSIIPSSSSRFKKLMNFGLGIRGVENTRGTSAGVCTVINAAINIIAGFYSGCNQYADIGIYALNNLDGVLYILRIHAVSGPY